jgi:2-keto-4-pentenoate hydratase/2-oxohepta-3-ene-1,7-dioic acid hydratase in catechol pathway
MKILRFEYEGLERLGTLEGNQISAFDPGVDIYDLIESWQAGDMILVGSERIKAISVRWLAPIFPRRNLFCVGWNYLKHYDESIGKREGQEVPLPDKPTFFSKVPQTVVGPYDEVPLHADNTQKLDWEVELAVIIGRAGRDISESEALKHVFGYSVANDLSARDVQRAHGGQWFKGKSLDSTCPLGPVIVSADQMQDPQSLSLTCAVNGIQMQSGHTSRQIFTVAQIIAQLSAGLTLLPGDIILTGTPEGIGAARTPPVYLQEGDLIECEINGIGMLRNTVRALTK